MSYLSDRLLSLVKQLLPNGRAFWVPPQQPGTGAIYTDEAGDLLTDEDGNYLVTEDYTPGSGGLFERFLKSFSGDGANRLGTTERLISDGDRVIDSLIPDNDNFTDGTTDPNDNDCADGERRWHLIQYGVTSAMTPTRAQRMANISVRMNYPGTTACRQSAPYLASQLIAAGFAITVLSNEANYSPSTILGTRAGRAYFGAFDFGEADFGETWATRGISICANHIDEALDADFVFPPGNFHGAFYIFGMGGFGTFANVPLVRKAEFRQQILRLKGAHMVGILFVNYV